jgi:hypothetical protein
MPVKAAGSYVVAKAAEWAGRNPNSRLAGSMQYLNASPQASSEGAEGFERQIQFGFHCKEPQGGFMKRNLIGTLSLVVLSLLLNATGAYAQSAVKADVPFAFTLGTAQLPAGPYEVAAPCGSCGDQKTITIRNLKTGTTVLLQVQPEYRRDTSDRLVFHHLGNQYFLAEIWGDAGSAGMTIPASKLEKELRIASSPSNTSKEVVMAHK